MSRFFSMKSTGCLLGMAMFVLTSCSAQNGFALLDKAKTTTEEHAAFALIAKAQPGYGLVFLDEKAHRLPVSSRGDFLLRGDRVKVIEFYDIQGGRLYRWQVIDFKNIGALLVD